MSYIWVIGYLCTAIGFSIGGVIAWSINGFQKKTDFIYSVCVGLTLGVLSFEIVPEAIELGNWITFILGFFVGIILFEAAHKTLKILFGTTTGQNKSFSIQTGILLILSISFHNLPIGIVLGSTRDTSLEYSLLQAILLHNVPEGIIVFTLLYVAGHGIWSWLFFSLIIAAPVGIGAYFGSTLGTGNPLFWSFAISLAAGTIYMIIVKEVIIEAIKDTSHVLLIAIISFGCIGFYFFLL
ncbi:ZIP family metal transporter [Psychrobacillus sp. NPDC096623]|uniref:ZIP family metal transporter n=1 Tax=Psychrobacillus sp. NPDC096623 TaxID=3364492 RepID=UPI0037F5116F